MLRSCFPSVMLLIALALLSAGTTADYRQDPEARAMVDRLVAEDGLERNQLMDWLGQARRQEQVLSLIRRPAEKTLTWGEYRSIFLTERRTRLGHRFLNQHEQAFARAEDVYGVPRAIVAAIIGVETRYGDVMGSIRVLDALATLAFDYPPRSDFFRGQLAEYFRLVHEQDFEVTEPTGSYAGAMGYGQFIPGSYRHYARDFDGDGVVDLMGSPVDAIGSVAHYMARHDWQPGQPVAVPVDEATPSPALLTEGLKPRLTLADYRRAGIDDGTPLASDTPARLLALTVGDQTRYWLTFPNFYAITRYNHSHLYAMAVLALSRTLETDEGKG
ncbi:lytic murein transglycosylase B [Tamilnaduibacter salinus]|uniref:Lytic murein transglycosylase B n=1 Tax=Tamilnaduibacter salinus TaxID=1484056 RepID=A0A2A2I4Q5_9GAMM|nr:lytic murein transglycosylase B [Tamilnaduibacter salinus]PAV26003.1 lytic murein transglycosylase B [Tamilnaduibacter salinus]